MKTNYVILVMLMVCTVFDAENTSTTCPEKCSCIKFPKTIDCKSGRKRILNYVPYPIPNGIEIIILDNNNISQLNKNVMFNATTALSISLKNNTVSEIKDATFQRLNKLQYLNLQNNQIKFIQKHTFLGLYQLQYLQIDNNLIHEIECAAFSEITNLKSLNLSYNWLKSINNCMFKELINLIILDISSNQIQYIEPRAFANLFLLEELKINDNLMTMINAEWFEDKQLSMVNLAKNLWVCSCKLYHEYINAVIQTKQGEINCTGDNMCLSCELPIHTQFSKLNEVKTSYTNNLCNNGNLSLLNKKSYRAYDKAFNDDQNKKQLSRTRRFTNNTQLRSSSVATSLECFHDLICSLPRGSVEHVLKTAIPVGVVSLSLSSNAFTAINVTDLEGFVNLTSLDVAQNKIHIIDDYSFKDQAKLEVLTLNNNLISRINKNTFYGLSGLRDLTLAENKITGALQTGVFQYLTSLQKLELSINNIAALEDCAFCNLTALTHLLLDNNNITRIQNNSFQSLSNLQELDLSNNMLTTIDFFVFPNWLNILKVKNNRWNCNCNLKNSFDAYIYTTTLSINCTNELFKETCVKCSTPSSLLNRYLHELTETVLECYTSTTAVPTTVPVTTLHTDTTVMSTTKLITTSSKTYSNITPSASNETSFGSAQNTTTKPIAQPHTGINDSLFWRNLILAVSIPAAIIIVVVIIALVYDFSSKPSTSIKRSSARNPSTNSGALTATNPSADHTPSNTNRSNAIELDSVNVFEHT